MASLYGQAPRPRATDAQLERWVRGVYLRICNVIGLVLDAEMLPRLVLDTNVPNASSNGYSIRVNIAWVRRTLAQYCDELAPCGEALVAGVLVHELTHHVFADAFMPADALERRSRERRADFWAGFFLEAVGMDTSYLERTIGDPASCCDLYYDPPWERAAAAREGAAYARSYCPMCLALAAA